MYLISSEADRKLHCKKFNLNLIKKCKTYAKSVNEKALTTKIIDILIICSTIVFVF